MYNNGIRATRKTLLPTCFFIITAGLTSPVRAQTESVPSHQSASPRVPPSAQRIVFDSSAFGPGLPVPHSDRGYLISRKVETFSPGTPNVMLYGKDGEKVREAAIWFPESIRVSITSAAVTPDGRIVASGEADKADGTRAPFIALTNLDGKLIGAIQTKDFYPTNVCVAPDNTVWSFGATWWDDVNDRPWPGGVLRHFDFQKGQLSAFIPRSTFPDHVSQDHPMYDSLTFMRCSSNEVAIFSTPESKYILMEYQGTAARLYNAPSPPGLTLTGFAFFGAKRAYASLLAKHDANDPRQGLYSLVLDEPTNTAKWIPVQGAVGPRTNVNTVLRAWGTDGEYLVLGRAQDAAGLAAIHWATISEK